MSKFSQNVLNFFGKHSVDVKDVTVDEQDLVICSIFDVVSGKFDNPFVGINKDTVVRSFLNSFSGYPADKRFLIKDLRLFQLGMFNQDTGCISVLNQPLQIASGLDYKAPKD